MTGLKLNELGTVDETKQNCETNAHLTIQSALTSITNSCKCAPLHIVQNSVSESSTECANVKHVFLL